MFCLYESTHTHTKRSEDELQGVQQAISFKIIGGIKGGKHEEEEEEEAQYQRGR